MTTDTTVVLWDEGATMHAMNRRQRRTARQMKRYPAILPVGSTYEGCPPSWDAPEPTDRDIEIAAAKVAMDRSRYPGLNETLGGDPYFLDRLHDLGRDIHVRPDLKLTDADLIRIVRTIQDCIDNTTWLVGENDLEESA